MSELPADHVPRGVTREADLHVPLDDNPLVPREPRPSRWLWRTAATVFGMCLSAALLKYAIDVLVILAGFLFLAIVLHAVARRLMESEFLTLPRFLVALAVAGAILAIAVPRGTFEEVLHVERYLPRGVVRLIERAEQRGWGQRALVPPGRRGGASPAAPARERPR